MTSFEFRSAQGEHGSVIVDEDHEFEGTRYPRVIYMLFRCGSCGRGGLAEIHCAGKVSDGELGEFYPKCAQRATLPTAVPHEIQAEVREAETCMAAGAYRAASAMLRSALEKTLSANGYVAERNLKDQIDKACADAVITESRKKRAQEDVRVLGNEILHEEWRAVSPEDVVQSHRYVQRILEDFYDDRPAVEEVLKRAGRLP